MTDIESQVKKAEDRQLDAVSAYVEETAVDAQKAKAALDSFASTQSNQTNQTVPKITIARNDIEYIAEEFELSNERAEELLKHHAIKMQSFDLKTVVNELLTTLQL